MKLTIRSFVLGMAVLVGCLALASPASAVTLTFAQSLGLVVSGEPSSPADEVVYINTLVAQPLNSGPTTVSGHAYTRTGNTCGGACPSATATGSTSNTTGANTGDFGTGYQYLLAKYDGPNGGDVIWYVGGLTGAFDIPADASSGGFCTVPGGGVCGLSHWSLFNPTTGSGTPGITQPVVPEPASLLLLGSGLAGAAWRARRKKAVA